MTGTLGISGSSQWESCWRQACYMAQHVYSDPAPPGGFSTQWPDKIAEVDRNWEEWNELDEQSGSGFVARLFKVRGWDPDAPESPVCPPCLAFRGTDFDDMRDIAIAPKVTIMGFTVFDTIISMDERIDASVGRDALVNRGFSAVPIYSDSGTVWVEGANFGIRAPFPVSIELEILTRSDGDWLSNIMQGLGRRSQQYEQAKLYGRRIVPQFIRPLAVKRLEITGHSLGGGLAAAVCTVLSREFPFVFFHAITFNAAGVHANTVAPASLGSGSIDNFTVEDEILTTVQSFTSQIPVAGAIFRMAERTIGQRGMPPALGTMQVVRGESPGGHGLGPRGSTLPNLFPIAEQTLVTSHVRGFRILLEIDRMLAGSPSVTQFGNRFLEWLNRNYRERALATAETTLGVIPIWRLYQEMGRHMMRDIQPEIDTMTRVMLASVSYHSMDVVIATYEKRFRRS
ncbi:MAG: hypothetical protein JJT81_05010 [Rubellimicrobium sp.]|nr:hypothetical protein [Rubellimicrobium sp.]